jgi:hypothetical protein
MSSKKTSKTTPKPNTKRYLLFVWSNYDDCASDSFRGKLSREEVDTEISKNIDADEIDEYDVQVYDLETDKWINLDLEPNKVKVIWPESMSNN